MEISLDNQGLILLEGRNLTNSTFFSNGSGKCLSGNTRVYDIGSNQYIPIKDFVEAKKEWTLGLNDDYKVVPVRVTDWHTTGRKKMLRITSRSGATIKSATTHPFLTGRTFKKAKDLEVGDWIAETRLLPPNKKGVTIAPEFFYAIGALIGDGGLTEAVNLTTMEPDIVLRTEKAIQLEFPNIHLSNSRYKTGKAMTYCFIGDGAFRKFIGLLGLNTKSIDKSLADDFIGCLSVEQVKMLLSGLYNTDGEIPNISNKGPRRVITFTTASKKLAYNIKDLWLKLGIPVHVRPRKVKGRGEQLYWRVTTLANLWEPVAECLDLSGEPKERLANITEYHRQVTLTNMKAPQNNIDVIPPEFNSECETTPKNEEYKQASIGKYYGNQKVSRTVKQLREHAFSRDVYGKWVDDETLSESDVFWGKVSTIEEIPPEICYDLTVDSANHIYIADNFFVHNSNVLSTVPYALYGSTPENEGADDIVNKDIGKGTSVILDFEVDGLPYTIERYRKHKTYKNKVRLLQGDKDLTEASVAKTNAKILDLFGIDFNTFLNSIMYGQGDVEIFSQASDKGKKEILENVANIAIYQKAQEQAKQVKAQLELELARVDTESQLKTQELANIEYQETSDKENYKKTQELIKQKEEDLKQAVTTLENKRAELEGLKGTLEVDLEEVKKALDNQQPVQSNQEVIDDYNAFYAKYTQLDNAVQLKYNEVSQLKNQIEQLGTSTTCSLCGAPLNTEHREKERARLEEQIKQIEDQLATATSKQPTLEKLLRQKQQAVKGNSDKIDQYNQEKYGLQSKAMSINSQLQDLGGSLIPHENTVTSIKEQLDTFNKLTKPKSRTKEKNKVKKELEYLRTTQEKTQKDVEEYDLVIKDVYSNKGVRSQVLDLVTPFLNERANYYLETLSGADISINFSTQKENKDGTLADNFDLQITNSSGGGTYKSNSAGERKRVDLSIALAIQDLIFSKSNLATNLAVYDECFDGLDSVGCENVIQILKDKQKEIGTIFVITHNENLKSLFENVVTLEKVDGVTKLVTD